jgi:hypothetical protein
VVSTTIFFVFWGAVFSFFDRAIFQPASNPDVPSGITHKHEHIKYPAMHTILLNSQYIIVLWKKFPHQVYRGEGQLPHVLYFVIAGREWLFRQRLLILYLAACC